MARAFLVKTSTGIRLEITESWAATQEAERLFSAAGELRVSPFSVSLHTISDDGGEGEPTRVWIR